MMPLTRFDTIFCKPKPIPTPIAPEKKASAERSMPTVDSVIRMAKVIRSSRVILPINTWIEGVRSVALCTRLSRKSLAAVAAHKASISSTAVLMTSSAEMRRPPMTMATESRVAIVGCRRPTMLSAAKVHAEIATSR